MLKSSHRSSPFIFSQGGGSTTYCDGCRGKGGALDVMDTTMVHLNNIMILSYYLQYLLGRFDTLKRPWEKFNGFYVRVQITVLRRFFSPCQYPVPPPFRQMHLRLAIYRLFLHCTAERGCVFDLPLSRSLCFSFWVLGCLLLFIFVLPAVLVFGFYAVYIRHGV